MKQIARLIIKYAVAVSMIGSILGIIGAYYTILIYKNLRTDVEELLPSNARSIVDLNEVTRRLEAIDNIVVLIFSKHPHESKNFVIDLAHTLEKAPKNVVSAIEYKISDEIKFFSKRKALMMDTSDLEKIDDFIRTKISYEKELYNPLNIFSQMELKEPTIQLEELKKKYEQKSSAYAKFPGGFYASPDETVRVLIAYMPGKGIEAAHKLRSQIDAAVQSLHPKSYSQDIEIKFTGNIQNLIEENAALIADLIESTLIVLLLVTAAMLLFYRSFLGTLALVSSLFIGTFWTFGVSYFVVGYLNANSAFLASIVIGNGINFGIILLARYFEEVRGGKSEPEAVKIAMKTTATSTLTAALAAGISYGSLILTDFRGFKQFGMIGLFGMVLCWISAYTLLPAYLTLLARVRKAPLQKAGPPKHIITGLIASAVDRFPKLIWGISCLLILASLWNLKNLKDGVIEVDLNTLRDRGSMEHGSGYYSKYISDIFQHGLSPMVVLPHTRDDARKLASAFKSAKAKEGQNSLFTTVQNLDDFIPQEQAKKVKILEDVRKQLQPKILARLSTSERQVVVDLLSSGSFHPFYENDLPPALVSKFRERDGSLGKMVLVDKIMGHGTDRIDVQIPFVQEVRKITDTIAPGTPIAGQLPVTADMLEAVLRDGPRATLFAFLAVVILVIGLFHQLKIIGQVLLALVIGVIWLAGIILGFHLKINFLNFIALPITFGIGVDYGVNVFQRYREDGEGTICHVVRTTGGAVMLSSLTTIIGYSSLLIAGNQAFVSFGRLAVLGELTCVCAAVFAMPAFLRFLEIVKQNKNESIMNRSSASSLR